MKRDDRKRGAILSPHTGRILGGPLVAEHADGTATIRFADAMPIRGPIACRPGEGRAAELERTADKGTGALANALEAALAAMTDGVPIGCTMIAAGHAREDRRFSKGEYLGCVRPRGRP